MCTCVANTGRPKSFQAEALHGVVAESIAEASGQGTYDGLCW